MILTIATLHSTLAGGLCRAGHGSLLLPTNGVETDSPILLAPSEDYLARLLTSCTRMPRNV